MPMNILGDYEKSVSREITFWWLGVKAEFPSSYRKKVIRKMEETTAKLLQEETEGG